MCAQTSSKSSFLCRGLDNRVYYMLAPQGQYYNFSGCGNTFNCNHPVVQVRCIDVCHHLGVVLLLQALIVAALRYWVAEMHVDGSCPRI